MSWDEALDLVAGELKRVRETFGAEAIFGGSYGWSSAGRLHHARSLVRRFLFLGGGCVDQVGNYSWGAAQFLLPHVIGTYQPVTGRVTDWPVIVEHTKLVIAFGGLRAEERAGDLGRRRRAWPGSAGCARAKEAGVRFVVVSPLQSDVPDFLDAQWIPIRPNTDTALMLAMAHTLVSEQRHDRRLSRQPLHRLRAIRALSPRAATTASPRPPNGPRTSAASRADTIRDLARRAADVRSFITCAWSLQRAHRGEQPYWMAITLAAMLGGIGLPGGGFGFGHGSMNGVGAPRIGIPGPGLSTPPNPAKRAIPVARIADMLLNPGAAYEFNGRSDVYPDIKLVYWAGGNPFHHHQDLNRLRRGWQRPQTIIVNESWWTPTARHADIVLPVTTTLERNDIGGSSRDPFIFAMRKAIEPTGDARSDFDIFRALAARLGYEQAFTEGRDEMAWCQWIYDRVRAGAADKGVELPGFQQFWAEGHVELPPPAHDFTLFEDFRREPARHPLKTPSGRIEIASETIAGFGYDDCPMHPTWMAPAEWLGSPRAGLWPLHLVTHQPSARLHSQMDPGPVSQRPRSPGARRSASTPPMPASPQHQGRRSGARVQRSRRLLLPARSSMTASMPQVAVMATGAWFDPAEAAGAPERHGNPNVLTLDTGTSRLTQGPSALSALVEVERWTGAVAPVQAFTKPLLATG